MASGNKRMVLNTRERLVSTDHNRLQAFAGEHVAEIFRYMSTYLAGEGGAASIIGTTTSPMLSIVLNGLWARPEVGTVNLFIEPGVAGMVNPDASPSSDDSPFKVFKDDGVQLAGQLTLTPGGGGATRIDVIEFARIEQVEESDNRDIFNPATGLFAPTLVDKVISDRLTYRIRTGTPGGGFPGTASGWTPIAVASVPNTATTWDQCIVWDVRPLVTDLVRAPAQVLQKFPSIGKHYGSAYSDGVFRRLYGVFESQRDQWRVGGEIGSTLSGLAGGALDLTSAEIIEPGFAGVGSLPWALYAMQPFGLPRWARYSPASSGLRVPLPFRGIPVLSQKTHAFDGKPVAAVSLPTAFGLGGSSTEGVAVATGAFDAGGTFLNASYADGWTRLAGFPATVSPASGANTPDPIYEIQDSTHFPRGAVALRARFATTLNASIANTGFSLQRSVRCLDAASIPIAEVGFEIVGHDSKNTSQAFDTFEVDIPLHAIASMPNGSQVTRRFHVAYSTSGLVAITYAAQSMRIVGWKMGM